MSLLVPLPSQNSTKRATYLPVFCRHHVFSMISLFALVRHAISHAWANFGLNLVGCAHVTAGTFALPELDQTCNLSSGFLQAPCFLHDLTVCAGPARNLSRVGEFRTELGRLRPCHCWYLCPPRTRPNVQLIFRFFAGTMFSP